MTKRVSQYEFPAAKSFWRKLSSFITARLCQKLNRSANGECQGGDSNSRPRAYESPALPLSYPGQIGDKGQSHDLCCQRKRKWRSSVVALSLALSVNNVRPKSMSMSNDNRQD